MPHSLQQNGSEPEYYITTIAKIEAVPGGAVRLYLATRRDCVHRLEYTAVIPASAMVTMAHMLLEAAANWKEPSVVLVERLTAH